MPSKTRKRQNRTILNHQSVKETKAAHLLIPLAIAGIGVGVDVGEEVPCLPHQLGGGPRLRLEKALHDDPRQRQLPPNEAGPTDPDARRGQDAAAECSARVGVRARGRWRVERMPRGPSARSSMGRTRSFSPSAAELCNAIPRPSSEPRTAQNKRSRGPVSNHPFRNLF